LKPIRKVSRKVWYKMLEVARELDLDEGGIYDARSSAINIWVSPQDKPEDYNLKITKGALKYPRAYLATIYGKTVSKDEVQLFLDVCNYDKHDLVEEKFNKGIISYKDYLKGIKEANKGTVFEWNWAKRKLEWLIDIAVKESCFVKVLRCPFCGKTGFKLLNELVECISQHTRVKSVIIGLGIETEKGLLTFKDDLTAFVKRE